MTTWEKTGGNSRVSILVLPLETKFQENLKSLFLLPSQP